VAAAIQCACGQQGWPEPPAIDQKAYQDEWDEWRMQQHALVGEIVPIVGVWPLEEGDTAFGADTRLPIALSSTSVPARAGVFRRAGKTVTLIPEPGARLLDSDDTPITKPTDATDDITLGSLRMFLGDMGDDRRWVTAWDGDHPAAKSPPAVETYPLDRKWRLSARFFGFDTPRPVHVPDVRGGTMMFNAVGQLVFRVNGQETRFTAFGEPGGDLFFVMFKDATNQSTTYSGYRILTPRVVASGEWTVLDFNFASNPPCAYSRFTLCPLPPKENQLLIAVEAGLKRLPSAQGYSPL